MKLHQAALIALLFVTTALVAIVYGPIAAGLTLFVGGNLITPQEWIPKGRLCVTLTTDIILMKTIEALVTKRPVLSKFSHEFTTERLKLGQQAIAHIKVKPTVSSYDANAGGYEAGAVEARDLLVDVPLIMDQHKHVTIKLSHLNAIADNKVKLEQFFADQGEVLGRGMTNYAFGHLRAANFSNRSTFSVANSDKDMLNQLRRELNTQGARTTGRFGIVTSDVMEVLEADDRISNRNDGASQNSGENSLMVLRNVSGFSEIVEDPDFTSEGSAISATAEADDDIVTTASAHGLIVGDRVIFPTLTGGTGLAADGTVYFVKTVPSTTTLTLSATDGGGTLNITADATAPTTIRRIENVTGFFGSEEALAIKTGLPTDSIDMAEAFGIPVPVSTEVVTHPDYGLSMVAYKWFKPGLMDAYVTVAFMYGAAAGRQGGTAGSLMDKAGRIVRTA